MSQGMSIPFFNYPYLYKKYEKEYKNILHDVMSRGAYILQKDLQEFEKNLAEYVNVKYAFGVANGTDALIIALRATGIKQGDEVILPSHTYIATAAAVHFAGARPVLVECGKDHLIDPVSVDSAVTDKTACIMPVQLNGRTADMHALQQIADKHGLKVVEDAAQALGSKFRDRHAGTFGLAGIYSFYPAKTLGCFGDGGAIITNDEKVAEKISLLRDHGRNENGLVVTWGYNSRLDNLQAAILNFKLNKYQEEIDRRREIASIYNNELQNIDSLVMPPPPDNSSDHFDVFQNYEIEADSRDDLKTYLADKGIGTLIQWGGRTVHQFKELGFNINLPFTERMISRALMLPMNTSLEDEEVYYICDAIKQFY